MALRPAVKLGSGLCILHSTQTDFKTPAFDSAIRALLKILNHFTFTLCYLGMLLFSDAHSSLPSFAYFAENPFRLDTGFVNGIPSFSDWYPVTECSTAALRAL